MSKIRLLYAVLFFCVLFSYAEENSDVFLTNVNNATPYDIFISGAWIDANKSETVELPLFGQQFATEYKIKYKINLTSNITVFYDGDLLKVLDNQENINVRNPKGIESETPYIILKNNSNNIISCGSKGQDNHFPYLKQNGEFLVKDGGFDIASGGTVVYSITNLEKERFAVKDEDSESPFPDFTLQDNYVYTFEYNGRDIIQTDVRPVYKMKESSWTVDVENNKTIENIIADNNSYYVVGTSGLDSEAPKAYIEHLDSEGNINLSTTFGPTGSTTHFFDVNASNSRGDIYTFGSMQRADLEDSSALIVKYDPDGAMETYFDFPNNDFANIVESKSLNETEFFIAGIMKDKNFAYYTTVIDKGLEYEVTDTVTLMTDEIISDVYLDYGFEKIYVGVNTVSSDNIFEAFLFVYDKTTNDLLESDAVPNMSIINDMMVTPDGSLYIAGKYYPFKDDIFDARIIKRLADGTLTSFYAGKNFSSAESIAYDETDGEIIFSGYLTTTGEEKRPFLIARDFETNKDRWNIVYDKTELEAETIEVVVPALEYGYVLSSPSLLHVASSGRLNNPVIAHLKSEVQAESVSFDVDFTSQFFSPEILNVKLYRKDKNKKIPVATLSNHENLSFILDTKSKEPGTTDVYGIDITYVPENSGTALIVYSEEREVTYADSAAYVASRDEQIYSSLSNIYTALDQFTFTDTTILIEDNEKFIAEESELKALYAQFIEFTDANIEYFDNDKKSANFSRNERFVALEKDIEKIYKEKNDELSSIKVHRMGSGWDSYHKNRTGILITPSLYFTDLSFLHERKPFDGIEFSYYGPTLSHLMWGITAGYNDPLGAAKLLASVGVNATIQAPIGHFRPFLYAAGGGYWMPNITPIESSFGLILRAGTGIDILWDTIGVTLDYSVDWYQRLGFVDKISVGLFIRLDGEN